MNAYRIETVRVCQKSDNVTRPGWFQRVQYVISKTYDEAMTEERNKRPNAKLISVFYDGGYYMVFEHND